MIKKDILYLIKYENIEDYVKIGITNDLEKRIRQLNTGCPTKVKVVFSHRFNEKAGILERHYHKKYARSRTNLEWFNIPSEEIQEIIHDLLVLGEKQKSLNSH